MTRRSILLMPIAVVAAAIGAGCGGGDQIPLAKIEPSSEAGNPTKKSSPPKGAQSSPTELIYK